MMEYARIHVNTAQPYDAIVGRGLYGELGVLMRAFLQERIAGIAKQAMLVADETAYALYGSAVSASLTQAGMRVFSHVLDSGEQSKSVEALLPLLEGMAEQCFLRSDWVVSLGGGVAGDVAGFAASLYMRGMNLLHLPTTLLAAADSSIGGKSALNLAAGKNMIGAVYQPALVVCDCDALASLTQNELRNGLAECIKSGVIGDEALFALLEKPFEEEGLPEIIARSIALKVRFVEADVYDKGVRHMLNLGHTVAHALERLSNYALPHGMAVAVGIAVMARAAKARGMMDGKDAARVIDALLLHGLPTDTTYTLEEIYDAALRDKKRIEGDIALAFPRRIGACSMERMPIAQLKEVLRDGLNE